MTRRQTATSVRQNYLTPTVGIQSGDTVSSERQAMLMLLKAYDYAEEFNVSPWYFAVEICDLRAAGVMNNDLRWLISAFYVEHAQEVEFHAETARQFDSLCGLSFSDRSCFVLTEAGKEYALTFCGEREERPKHESLSPGSHRLFRRKGVAPHWDPERHELSVESCFVKRFKTPAMNQETILMAFEEESWPSRIDDPLPPLPEIDPRRRLHDAIKCLNRHQLHKLVHFRGDGTGEGIVWEFVDPNSSGRPRQFD